MKTKKILAIFLVGSILGTHANASRTFTDHANDWKDQAKKAVVFSTLTGGCILGTYLLYKGCQMLHRKFTNRPLDGSVVEEIILPTNIAKKIAGEAFNLNPMSSNFPAALKYVNFLKNIPTAIAEEKFDLQLLKERFTSEIYGFQDAKDRVINHFAKKSFVVGDDLEQKILCFVGPPGCGKTVFSEIIANVIDKPFKRICMAAVNDAYQVSGLPRFYTGADPGDIAKAFWQNGVTNGVIILDEIDKMSKVPGTHGSAPAALLQALDPSQNKEFVDKYIDTGIDLSKTTFIATANDIEEIPWPLRDRMEIIELEAYSTVEKIKIAREFIIPKTMKNVDLGEEFASWGSGDGKGFELSDNHLNHIIEKYTVEAGVRSLSRCIIRLTEWFARQLKEFPEEHKEVAPIITEETIENVLRGQSRPEVPTMKVWKSQVGVTNSMYWSLLGGGIGKFEAIFSPSLNSKQGRMLLTATATKTTKEAVKASYAYVVSHSSDFGISEDYFKSHDLRVHIPGLGTTIDGPSAGVAQVVAIVSAALGRKIDGRSSMTGEVDLKGNVLPIGGLKQKVSGAKKVGIKRIFVPSSNRRQIDELHDYEKEGIKFVFASHVCQVVDQIFVDDDVVTPSFRDPQIVSQCNAAHKNNR
ncbi:AAA family ATPase [bacterium]|nr:AAA family ATPase [bacterium]